MTAALEIWLLVPWAGIGSPEIIASLNVLLERARASRFSWGPFPPRVLLNVRNELGLWVASRQRWRVGQPCPSSPFLQSCVIQAGVWRTPADLLGAPKP